MLNQQDAKTYCSGLSLAGGGWSLPAIAQLKTILLPLKDPQSGCYIDGCVFGIGSCGAYYFWSSTPFAGTTQGYAWMVYFHDGFADNAAASSTQKVRCVR
jgi:hypothetical protein